jgi:hypothetical protein
MPLSFFVFWARSQEKVSKSAFPPSFFSLSVRWHVTNNFCGIYFHKVNKMNGSWQEICAAVSIVLKSGGGGGGESLCSSDNGSFELSYRSICDFLFTNISRNKQYIYV